MRWCFCYCVTSSDANVVSVYLCFPCFCVKVTVSVSLFPMVCPSVILLNYTYFLSPEDEVWKYDDLAAHRCHTWLSPASLCFFVLWFVTWHPSPPTSLRFWSTLGWLVIMLMQLCSIKVSAPTPLSQSPPRSPITFLFACLLPPASVSFSYCVILTMYCRYFNIVCSVIHYQYLLHQLENNPLISKHFKIA